MKDKQEYLQNWHKAIMVYTERHVIVMVFLGFSAGLPFLLVFSTLSAWLRDVGLELTTIGFFSWIGITYSIKFMWAPVIDRLPLPVMTRLLGKRRAWMLLAQIAIALGLLGLSGSDPLADLSLVTIYALVIAFGSATQDITVDAYRIEVIERDKQGAMVATYVLGYRIALLVAGAGAFYLASFYSWRVAYLVMASLACIGIITTLLIDEPVHDEDGPEKDNDSPARTDSVGRIRALFIRVNMWFVKAVINPFVEFFNRFGRLALVILLLVGCYRISDIVMGVMANPFYLDMGYSKIDIANITKVFGFFMTIFGAGLGGIVVVHYGIMKPLITGAILVVLTNLLFVWLAGQGPDIAYLALVVSADNFSGGFAVAAFIAYLSSLTNQSYTATQYALFSSLMTLPAKILGGYAGMVVDAAGYSYFFFYAAILGLPAILLTCYLSGRTDN